MKVYCHACKRWISWSQWKRHTDTHTKEENGEGSSLAAYSIACDQLDMEGTHER